MPTVAKDGEDDVKPFINAPLTTAVQLFEYEVSRRSICGPINLPIGRLHDFNDSYRRTDTIAQISILPKSAD